MLHYKRRFTVIACMFSFADYLTAGFSLVGD